MVYRAVGLDAEVPAGLYMRCGLCTLLIISRLRFWVNIEHRIVLIATSQMHSI